MHRVGRWLERGRSQMNLNGSSQSLDSLEESHNLDVAMRAVELIMDDDIEGAEKGLADGNSSFHKLAKGTLAFMKAALGAEQEMMNEASGILYEAESSAYTSHGKAQHDSRAFHSKIYDRGTEFILCQAEAQIMSAVVGVLNESLTESIKGFYKLRKAYLTLDSIVTMETNYIKNMSMTSLGNSVMTVTPGRSRDSSPERNGGHAQHRITPAHASGLRMHEEAKNDDSDDDDFHDADSKRTNGSIDEHRIRVTDHGAGADLEKKTEAMSISQNSNNLRPTGMLRRQTTISAGLLTEGPESSIFQDPLDVFIHSGTNLMAGLLNLLISIIPPAFSKLLYIVGFRGDREKGIRMLWQASRFPNVNGGMAGLILFGWYNGIIGFCDIVSENDPTKPDDIDGYPAQRLENLLMDMRRRYPNSNLWLVEEARTRCSNRNIDGALKILMQPSKSQMKQIEALHMFERALNAMHAHRYQLCADSIITCVDLNAWSKALYVYIAASAHLCYYRYDKTMSAEEKQKHAKIAEELFKSAPSKVTRKKMMGRQLPFDTFVVRKIAKWEERAARFGCDFVDAVGISPLDEMIFFWNGFKKMNETQLQDVLDNLAWSEQQPRWEKEDVDEHAIIDFLRAVIYRNLRDHEQAKSIFQKKLLHQTAHDFRGAHMDNWMAPTAQYEMSVNLWQQRTAYIRQHGTKIDKSSPDGVPDLDLHHDAKLIQEIKTYLEKAKGWEKYELDARLGMKITAGLACIKRWEHKNAAYVK
jgi:hypothetical protein